MLRSLPAFALRAAVSHLKHFCSAGTTARACCQNICSCSSCRTHCSASATHARARSCAALAAGRSGAPGAGQRRQARRHSWAFAHPWGLCGTPTSTANRSPHLRISARTNHGHARSHQRPEHPRGPGAGPGFCPRTALQPAGQRGRGGLHMWPHPTSHPAGTACTQP